MKENLTIKVVKLSTKSLLFKRRLKSQLMISLSQPVLVPKEINLVKVHQIDSLSHMTTLNLIFQRLHRNAKNKITILNSPRMWSQQMLKLRFLLMNTFLRKIQESFLLLKKSMAI